MSIAIGRDQRFSRCISNLYLLEHGTYHHAQKESIVVNSRDSKADIVAKIANMLTQQPPHRLEELFMQYVEPILKDSEEIGGAKSFAVIVGDYNGVPQMPTFCKTRNLNFPQNGILNRISQERHFAPLQDVEKFDRPWSEKKSRLVWRGATTGRFTTSSGLYELNSRFYVPDVIGRLESTDIIDMGYSEIIQIKANSTDRPMEDIEASIRDKSTMSEQLENKYILSLEGNDVASGMKWALYSRSTVIMPRPRCESWLCESFLKPFVHYVPVEHDLSNLYDVVEWCRNNDAECRDIANNGREYILPFLEEEPEKKLAERITKEYLKRVRFAF